MSLLELKAINKSFANNKVLVNVSISFEAGEIHSIVGENGAGKSTLMKIIGGIYSCDSGEIIIEGKPVTMHNPLEAFEHGIGIVHQELSLAANMTVAQNIFVNREPVNKFGFIDWKMLNNLAGEELKQIGMDINPNIKAGTLSVGMQQIVEITKVLSQNVKILIMDEPTSALSDKETENLFQLLLKLKVRGTLIIFISHKLQEVKYLSDKVSVLRDGNFTGTLDKEQMEIPIIINRMVGRNIDSLYPDKAKSREGGEILRLENVSRGRKFQNVSLCFKRGEITGLFGLIGAGRTELAFSVFGADRFDSGCMYLNGERIRIRSPREAIAKGVAYLSEDRKGLGLFIGMNVLDNIIAASLGNFCNRINMLRDKKAISITEQYIRQLEIHPQNCITNAVFQLSGGNQQKVLMAKWLAIKPQVLIVDEPTRGVDVGAKSMIHKMLRELADEGMAIVMISSELPEILGLSDRVAVMHEGTCKAVMENDNLTEELIMNRAFGKEAEVDEKQM